MPYKLILATLTAILIQSFGFSQGTRLLRQPHANDNNIVFTYGSDIWVADLNNSRPIRITSTPAVEKNPHISPDGKTIAFTSNRAGRDAVYIVPIEGGTPKRLTWHPSPANVKGWSIDEKSILYATSRNTGPKPINHLWTVSTDGTPPTKLTTQWAVAGSFSADGDKIAIDRVNRWDKEWRAYRGGQNTSLIILDLKNNSEELIPNEKTTDVQPVWIGDKIYFLSDRDWVMNIWAYDTKTKDVSQITNFTGSDIKHLSGGKKLTFERDGYLFQMNPSTQEITQLEFTVIGDFPWAETKWQDVSRNVSSASISPNGKRIIMDARGEIFTVPVEHGSVRNITQSSNIADRTPLWSPKGDQIAWFSDANKKYELMLAKQDGLSKPKAISIGESKMIWTPTWSPDGKFIAFVDDDLRIRVLNLESSEIKTIDIGGVNIERSRLGLTWSPDSKWLAYSKSGSNYFRGVKVWSAADNQIHDITNPFANAFSPQWDRDGKHLYFLASTDVALGSGWANTSSMGSNPRYAAYVVNLRKDDPSPFSLRSDEEAEKKDTEEKKAEGETEPKKGKKKGKKSEMKDKKEGMPDKGKKTEDIIIDFENIERRTISLPIPSRNYSTIISGPAGNLFIGERIPNKRGLTLHKFSLKSRKLTEFTSGVGRNSISTDGKKLLVQAGPSWKVLDTNKPNGKSAKPIKVNLQMNLDRQAEWSQIFEEAWRYERDFFYDPNMHGRDWDVVYKRYAPLIPFVKHRADLTYILDQVNGELSVGHSFVSPGDMPSVERSKIGLLGADLVAHDGRWKISRIYTTESWNPNLTSPLDVPGAKIEEGHYLVGINGIELTSNNNPYQFLDGTLNQQTVIHLNDKPSFEGSWQETIKPIGSDYALRQRAWVERNRQIVDSLSNGELAYVWVPNTSMQGIISFNRYFFAQQDKKGAVIDERFNGGGLLDDYMVDLMTRSPRAAYTNEVPNGKPGMLPAGILGPKVLLINEQAGSGGDFFPWVFRQQKAGQLIGATTWGGLVKSSVHYRMVDGGTLTAPDNAIFDPVKNEWIGENKGIAPNIEVRMDAQSISQGRDPQLERAVEEVMKLIKPGALEIKPPAYSTPAVKKN